MMQCWWYAISQRDDKWIRSEDNSTVGIFTRVYTFCGEFSSGGEEKKARHHPPHKTNTGRRGGRRYSEHERADIVIRCCALRQQSWLRRGRTDWRPPLVTRMADAAVNLVIKTPNQQIKDQVVKCDLGWTIGRLKEYLSEVYPSKPVSRVKVFTAPLSGESDVCFLFFTYVFFLSIFSLCLSPVLEWIVLLRQAV